MWRISEGTGYTFDSYVIDAKQVWDTKYLSVLNAIV